MKKSFMRVLATLIAASTLAVGMSSMSAGAYSIKQSNSKNTSGGTNGTIRICTEVYSNYLLPTSSVTVYYYGAKAYVTNSDTITTKMSLSGTFYKSNSSTSFSLNANKTNSYNDLSKSQSSYDSDAYVSLSTTTSSNDTAFGSCSYSTNGAFNGVF